MPEPRDSRELPPEALLALSQGKKIDAIKIVREQWRIGLKEAKDAVDARISTDPALLAATKNSSAAGKNGCIAVLVVLILAAIVAGYFLRGR